MLSRIVQLVRTMPFYAVKRGKRPGVYRSWPECEEQVKGFVGARFKKFGTENEAWAFANEPETPKSQVSGASKNPVIFAAASNSHSVHSDPMTRAATIPSAGGSSDTTAPTAISSTRLLALKGTIRNISQAVTQLQQFCTQAEQQVDQISRKRKAPNADPEEPASSRPRSNVTSGRSANTHGLAESEDGFVNVYTDGCCHNNGKPGAIAGIGVYWGPGHHMNVAERLSGKQTNNRAEILAASRAAQQAKARGITNLTIHTDSQFTINGITKWILKWKKNGWKLSTGETVINKEDFLELDSAIQDINVKWVYVRGHMGDPGNEAADQLANDGARS